ncbi:replication protein A 70 kDa DNA-binding subunit D [Artemisia annua]|uniref:Replication protein A 70 kDa DNA-binding subunit D n=1 Tax=Artemisia annua TaxID=35608 RepID=A0A2U1LVD7_ARTAN|nr:replication protein A 70 kDa DNA-binding subunit D [Artemisia annua]
MDQEGSRISATVGNKMVSEFESSLLREGGSVHLSNFYVAKNNGPYKVANHLSKINFHKKTYVKASQSVRFYPFTYIVEDNAKEKQVVDVIGHVGVVIPGERKGKLNRRMVIELEDIEKNALLGYILGMCPKEIGNVFEVWYDWLKLSTQNKGGWVCKIKKGW